MSALALHNPAFVRSELQALRIISNLTWNAESPEMALANMEEIILRIPGITGFRFERHGENNSQTGVSAVAQVAANGENYGQVRMLFDPNAKLGLESPVRFCKFLGQQLGLLFHRTDLQRQRQAHYSRRNALERSIRRRKSVRHAAAVLARQRNISQPEATALLIRYARENRKALLDVSDSLIFGTNFSKADQTHVR